ncbi:uncharacterized protein RSE6_13434 [Rhynchosporium secalis]|uniref:Uncharacterized protein n=1 Tax=Rhynchosporium secalis TaxID=38038 RepID=A0A1E1MSZ1_RHYSE|nr:uncharacterized protein RSE6_13434 [Rhynchosporium secalis]
MPFLRLWRWKGVAAHSLRSSISVHFDAPYSDYQIMLAALCRTMF